jgi:hypothetical protein
VLTDKEPYWLMNTVTALRNVLPENMSAAEANERNAFMERQGSVWRWMNRSEVERFEQAGS